MYDKDLSGDIFIPRDIFDIPNNKMSNRLAAYPLPEPNDKGIIVLDTKFHLRARLLTKRMRKFRKTIKNLKRRRTPLFGSTAYVMYMSIKEREHRKSSPEDFLLGTEKPKKLRKSKGKDTTVIPEEVEKIILLYKEKPSNNNNLSNCKLRIRSRFLRKTRLIPKEHSLHMEKI